MFLKIVVTILIILGAIVYIRMRSRKLPLAPAVQLSSRTVVVGRRRPIYYVALGTLLIMLVGTGYYLWRM